MLEFSAEERDVSSGLTDLTLLLISSLQVYDSFERESKIRLNRFIRDRTVVKKYVPFFNIDAADMLIRSPVLQSCNNLGKPVFSQITTSLIF